MSDRSLSLMFIGIAIVLAGGFVLILLLGGFERFGVQAVFLGSCEGIIEGSRCTSAACVAPDKDITARVVGIDHPRCAIFETAASCSAGGTVGNKTLCVWTRVAGNDLCLLSPDLTCENFGPFTAPECDELPRCNPVNAIEKFSRSITGGLQR